MPHVHRSPWRPKTRREFLLRGAHGFGALALGALSADWARADRRRDPLAPKPPQFEPRTRAVIFLYMDGGPSQVDTFDPKPRLDRENGQPIGMAIPKTQFDDVGDVLASPWKTRQRGESGLWVSDLLPHIASCADDICVVRSMVSKFPEHTAANYFLHTGHNPQGRPSMGAWIAYGLGCESYDLPGYVVLNGGLIPPGGIENFGSGFLPATYQGSVFGSGQVPLANVVPREGDSALQRRKLALLERLDRAGQEREGTDEGVEAAIANYELAFRMQAAVPELTGLSGESEATRRLYGFDHPYQHTRTYARQCLLARRLVERGVRFVELTCPHTGHDRWDQHGGLKKGHEDNARATDQPVAALLKDLKARGLLETTLVVWAGEFGRTPMAQGKDGRDHNPHGFSIWLAGGGVKAGHVHGETDEYGYFAVDGKVEIYDLHATMLHLLGMDHEKLTVRFSSRDMRLTDVHGRLVHQLLA